MIDYTELKADGEQWELFARDFLSEMGFVIDAPPDRGADLGKDFLVIENLDGLLSPYPFRWLVSCKNFAVSNKSVNEDDENNLLERIKSFKCDGFIGFYSTIPSAGLNTRLNMLKSNNDIKDYKIFDARLIENYLIKVGYSKLVMRYFPNSYKSVKPLHLLTDQYIPLECEHCNKDLLEELNREEHQANIIIAKRYVESEDIYLIEDVYWVCKGDCDRIIERDIFDKYGLITGWENITDLVIPSWYIRWVLTVINELHYGNRKYSDKAIDKMKIFILAMGQKVLREMTEKENERVMEMLRLPRI